MYSTPSQSQASNESHSSSSNEHSDSDSSNTAAQVSKNITESTPAKLLSSSGLLMAILLSLLFGLAYIVRSLKNVKLSLLLKLKRDDRAEKKY